MSDGAAKTTAQVMADVLAAYGVSRLYGLPGGGSNLEMIDACADLGIPYVLAHTECAAGIMAATDGNLGNRPGVVCTGLGPGATAGTTEDRFLGGLASLDGLPRCWPTAAPPSVSPPAGMPEALAPLLLLAKPLCPMSFPLRLPTDGPATSGRAFERRGGTLVAQSVAAAVVPGPAIEVPEEHCGQKKSEDR